MTAPRISYAQNAEDIRLARALLPEPPAAGGSAARGVYVDVGANDPTRDSVSRYFYDRGWSGVVVEPLPSLARAYAAARPRDRVCNVCAGSSDGDTELFDFGEGPASGLSTQSEAHAAHHAAAGYQARKVRVPVRRLDDLLREAGVTDVDFLSVDVEGSELDVLQSIDLTRFQPKVVVVEAIPPRASGTTHAAWEPLLLAAGYTFACFDGVNRFYVSPAHAHLAAALAVPPSAVDAYVPYAWSKPLEDHQREVAHLQSALRRPLVRAAWAVDRRLRRLFDRVRLDRVRPRVRDPQP